jgi:DNA-binding NarL/FixJ family response regulator
MAFALGPLLVRAISDKSAPRALVEDDALIAILLAELLAGMGHDVCATAATQAEAVIAATRYGTDLMIVDEGLGRGGAVFPPSRKYSARGRSHTCSSAEMRKACRGAAGRGGCPQTVPGS